MHEMDRTLVDRIATDLRTVRWAEAGELRALGRRRTRRTALLGSAAVLMIVASVGVVLLPRSDHDARPAPAAPSPTIPIPSPPTPGPESEEAKVLREAMLRESDLPMRASLHLTNLIPDQSMMLDRTLDHCRIEVLPLPVVHKPAAYLRWQAALPPGVARPADMQPRPRRQSPPPAAEPGPSISAGSTEPSPQEFAWEEPVITLAETLLTQDMYRMAPGVSLTFAAEIDNVVAKCGALPVKALMGTDDKIYVGEVVHRWEVTDRNFAGDDSRVVRYTPSARKDVDTGEYVGDPAKTKHAVLVRVGDLLTVIYVNEGVETPAELRELGRKAARRMCEATRARC